MKNLDLLNQKKAKIFQRMNQAAKDGDENAFAQAFTDFAQVIEEAVLAEARGLIQANDNTVLMGRGARVLTSEERGYYEKVMEAMRSANPQQALTMIPETLPKTVIESVFEDIAESHPLLDAIDFQNTGMLTEFIYSTLDARFMALWGKLDDEVTKELLAGFEAIDLTKNKLSAFIPVSKSMIDLGPEWVDRYVRAILAEALANGLEYGIVDGSGIDSPIGMLRNPAGALDPEDGYPALTPVALTEITPTTYGDLISKLAVNRNGLARIVTEVILVVNPVTYYKKVMPATTYQQPDGTWVNNRFPTPTRIIQSAHVPENKAIIGIGKQYFFGLGTGKGGKLEYSDHYRFLEDERIYLIKLYGNGQPKDNTSFIVLDVENLVPVPIKVTVVNADEIGVPEA